MSNSIPIRQNEELELRRLVATRRLYGQAKKILAWQIGITGALVVLWNLLVLWDSPLKVYAAGYGALGVLLDIAVFTPWQSGAKRTAAGIQELFDCYVLSLPWQEIKAGSPPDTETVTEWSQLRNGETIESFKVRDWYPREAGMTTLPLGRLICQRANCWWDARLRRRYGYFIVAFISMVFLFSVVFGLLTHASLEQFLLAGFIPFLPVFVIAARQFTDQRQAATRLDDLKSHSERLWTEALSGELTEGELDHRSRTLQDEIFEQRKRNALIFDWIYSRLRDKQEELMNKCASELLAEAQRPRH